MSDTEVKLVGGPSDDEGVLHARNPGVMAGFHSMPAESAARLTDGWINTGDVLRRDKEGFYYFVGRADDMFVCGGMNLYPATVERTMLRHPDIQQCSVIAVEDQIKGMVPWAFVVLRRNANRSEIELKSFAIEAAPAYQHPRRVIILESIPLAGTNKVDLRELRRLALTFTG
jgi:acyl-CoA synthetase (AMP-forming)/AMP-acid ligase II